MKNILFLLCFPLALSAQPSVTHQKLFRDTVNCVYAGGSQSNNLQPFDTVKLGDTIVIAYKCPVFNVTNSYDYLVFYAYPIVNYLDTLARIKIPYTAFRQDPACGNLEGQTSDLFKIKFAIPNILTLLDPTGRMVVRLPFSNQPEYNAVTLINGTPTAIQESIGSGKVVKVEYFSLLGQKIAGPQLFEICMKVEYEENAYVKTSRILMIK